MNDRVKVVDWLIAVGVGVAAAAALLVFSVPGLDPELWETAAIVKGILPPQTFFPGVWRYLPGVMSPLLGAIGGGVLAFLICLSVRTALVILARPSPDMTVWYRVYAPVLSGAAALLAIVSDPVWRSCQVLTPTLVLLIGFGLITLLFLSWLWQGRDWMLYVMMLVAGVIASECALVFLALPLFLACFLLLWRDIVNGSYKPAGELPDFSELPKWRMLLCFLLGLGVCVGLNIRTFLLSEGPAAAGFGNSDVVIRYAVSLLKALVVSASPIAWVLVLLIGLLPLFGAVIVLATRASDEEPLPFAFGMAALLCGIVGAFQVMPVTSAWFWQWNLQLIVVRDPVLLALVCIFSGAAVILALSTFIIDNSGRANQYEGVTHVLLKVWATVAVVAIVLFSLTGIWRPGISEMQRLVDDAVAETVWEAKGLDWIFTDGSCDPALELEAARRGQTLRPVNMMSSSSPRDIYLRLRGLTDEADIAVAKQGAPVMLRVWAGEKPGAMARAGVQLGFEFWKRANQKPPEAGGLLARMAWPDDAMRDRSRAMGDALAQRVLEIAARHDTGGASPALKKAYADVSWRLSRLARNRDQTVLADKLDAVNNALKRMLQAVEYERVRTFMLLTPREGLELALKRADFIEARRYASAVLKADEKDPEANFGLGMSYLLENRLKEAEFYLARCLKVRPHEPAVQNNLAIIFRKTGRPREAVLLARRAKQALPENPEVATTLREAEEAFVKGGGRLEDLKDETADAPIAEPEEKTNVKP